MDTWKDLVKLLKTNRPLLITRGGILIGINFYEVNKGESYVKIQRK